jgi:predicted kinase
MVGLGKLYIRNKKTPTQVTESVLRQMIREAINETLNKMGR